MHWLKFKGNIQDHGLASTVEQAKTFGGYSRHRGCHALSCLICQYYLVYVNRPVAQSLSLPYLSLEFAHANCEQLVVTFS